MGAAIVEKCQNIDKMILLQFFLLGFLFVSSMQEKFQMKCFWNVFKAVTKVSNKMVSMEIWLLSRKNRITVIQEDLSIL